VLKTRACALLGIERPVVLAGMGGSTNPELVAAVSNAGGLGILGCVFHAPRDIAPAADAVRELTQQPFGLNLLLFMADEAAVEAVLAARPDVFSSAWAWPDQDLRTVFARAHDVGAKVMHMVSTVDEARRAAESGADIIVAQGTEGGGHVGLMGTLVLVPQVVRAIAPVPVLAAGGVADGAGLAAALALGADGVLLGTRFLVTPEAPLPESFKSAICASDGHDTLLTESLSAAPFPAGAYVRVRRNRFVEEWIDREGELRRRRSEVAAKVIRARELGDVDAGWLLVGQTAGLIDQIEPAGHIVERLVQEAEDHLARCAALSAPT
jgi:NAD(P)H-dependent flavin oxidoreductase YrpB (nitropropane dioxygenase family)